MFSTDLCKRSREHPITISDRTINRLEEIYKGMREMGTASSSLRTITCLINATDVELLDERGENRGQLSDYYNPRFSHSNNTFESEDLCLVMARAVVLADADRKDNGQRVKNWLKAVLRIETTLAPIISIGDVIGFFECFCQGLVDDEQFFVEGVTRLATRSLEKDIKYTQKKDFPVGKVFVQFFCHKGITPYESRLGTLIRSLTKEDSGIYPTRKKMFQTKKLLAIILAKLAEEGNPPLSPVGECLLQKLCFTRFGEIPLLKIAKIMANQK